MAVAEQVQTSGAPMRRSAAFGAMTAAVPLNLRLEASWTLRLVLMRFLGGAMMVSAIGLWLMPEAGAGHDLTLVRLGISVALVLVGLALLSARDDSSRPEACFDPIRRELRVLQCDPHRRPRTVLRRSYDSLGGARLTAATVQLFENDGRLLIELPLGSATLRGQLRDQLSGAVRLLS